MTSQTELLSTELEKDLGVWVDPSLTFTSHCEIQLRKGNRTLGLIQRFYTYLHETSLTKLYTALVRSTLEYGYPAWSPIHRKDRVQRIAMKMVLSLKELPYEERLQALNLPSLYYRRPRGDVIELYRHIKRTYTVNNDYIKTEPANITRGHNSKIFKPRTNKHFRQNFLV